MLEGKVVGLGKGSSWLFTFPWFVVLLFGIVFRVSFVFVYVGMGLVQDRRCGDVASSSGFPSVTQGRNVRRWFYRRTDALRALPEYVDCGDYDAVCGYCGAFFWLGERYLKMYTPHHPRYYRCCNSGYVVLPYPSRMSVEFISLFANDHFYGTLELITTCSL
uniref:Uncharacterized protein n=1 Tax=Lactuca sativa TaxID=4236 RepID=A0A9R1WIY7_LACSA|nr:hypothetical protein LSAT_V11C100044000 [Lactuca sativa]